MGGHGSGGGPATGRKPDEDPFAADAPLPTVEPPDGLTEGQLAVWESLAPHALRQRTLIPATAHRFARLCRNIVLEQQMAAQIELDGLTETRVSLQMDEKGGGLQTVEKKAHALLSKFIAIGQRIDTGLTAFRLAPTGRALPAPKEKAQSALERLQAERGIRAVS